MRIRRFLYAHAAQLRLHFGARRAGGGDAAGLPLVHLSLPRLHHDRLLSRPPRHPPQRDGAGGRASRALVHKARDGEKEVLRRVRQRGGLHHLPDQLAGERRRGRGPQPSHDRAHGLPWRQSPAVLRGRFHPRTARPLFLEVRTPAARAQQAHQRQSRYVYQRRRPGHYPRLSPAGRDVREDVRSGQHPSRPWRGHGFRPRATEKARLRTGRAHGVHPPLRRL